MSNITIKNTTTVLLKLICKKVIQGVNVSGVITFAQNTIQDPLQVTVNISGLTSGQGNLKHGLHVHLYSIQSTSSNVTLKCGSAGPHFNPLNQTHGDISAKIRHVGDYGNIVSDNDGNILSTFNDTFSTLYGPLGNFKKGWINKVYYLYKLILGITGRTIVLHQLQDDLGLGNNTDSLLTGEFEY